MFEDLSNPSSGRGGGWERRDGEGGGELGMGLEGMWGWGGKGMGGRVETFR